MLEFLEIHECISPPLGPALVWLVQHLDGRRKFKWFKIMLVQHLDGRRKEKMVENHVNPISRWQEEGKNG